jgi:5-carboxyvanillate decarboxylase
MKIDIEAHFYTHEYHDYLMSRTEIPREELYKGYTRLWYAPKVWEPHGTEIEERLMDLTDQRIQAMDKAGIDAQVLSLSTPGCEQFNAKDGTEWARRTNDGLARAIEKHPGRLMGLAALAPQDPDGAAREFERAVKELGFKGAKINSHIGTEYMDDKKFWPVFEVAEKLDVPVYLHPNTPNPLIIGPFADYGFSLAGPVLGYGQDVALHVMRLIYAGLFDKYPNLKMMLGHMGEGLIFWIHRLDFSFEKKWMDEEIRPKIKKAPSAYLRNNFYITTSGMNVFPAFLSVFLEMGSDHLMFSSDYPYENIEQAANFIEHAPISDTDKEKIMHGTAEKLLKMG